MSANYEPIEAPAALLQWLKALGPAAPHLTGESLKFFAAGAPVARAVLPADQLQRRLEHWQQDPPPGWIRQARSGEQWRIWLDLETPDDDFHLLLHSEEAARQECRYSIDRLRFDLQAGLWHGDASDLADLEAARLRPLQDEAGPAAALQAIGAAAMLDFELPEDYLQRARISFRPEAATQLSRKFLNRQLRRLVSGRKPSRGFLYLLQTDILKWFLPELAHGVGLNQNRYHSHDIFYHSIYSCDAAPRNDVTLRLAALFHDLGKVDTRREGPDGEASFHNHEVVSARHSERILRRFGFDPQQARRIRFLVRNHMFHYTDEWTDRAVRRFTRRVSPDVLEDLIRLRLADRKGSGKRHALPRAIKELIRHIDRLRREEAELKIRDLQIDGNDLIAMGMAPGPAMGVLLAEFLQRVKEGELENDAATLRAIASERLAPAGALR
ncbi:MAG: HD domain-containing protein [Leptospirales bacterium]|nr:HD domain-containing protein [Leptospirales bacterium]